MKEKLMCNRRTRVAAGMCLYCTTVPPAPGKRRCQVCLDTAAEEAAARRDMRRKLRLCIFCPVGDLHHSTPGLHTCQRCRDKSAKRGRDRRRERREAVQCGRCKLPAVQGPWCEAHAAVKREQNKRPSR